MKNSDDHSLFAWTAPKPPTPKSTAASVTQSGSIIDEIFYDRRTKSTVPSSDAGLRGLLAKSPAEFATAENVVPFRKWDVSEPYSMTNKGLRITLPLVLLELPTAIGILDCHVQDNFDHLLGIPLFSFERDGD